MANIDLDEIVRETKNFHKPDARVIFETERYLEEKSQDALVRRQEALKTIKMRESWSTWILRTIVIISLANTLLIYLIGFGKLTFEHGNVVPWVIVDSILKIFGLAYIITNFLFPNGNHKSDEPTSTNP